MASASSLLQQLAHIEALLGNLPADETDDPAPVVSDSRPRSATVILSKLEAILNEVDQPEPDQAAKESGETERLQQEQLEKEQAKQECLEKERLNQQRVEQERLEQENERADQERLEQERAEQERLEKERLEQERAEQERAEQERLEQERLEQERLEKERLEQERAEKERLEQERVEQERLEKERLEQQRLEKERLEKERAEQQRLEKERVEQERLERERLEKERLEQERAEQERLEQERLEKERAERERLEKERAEQERLEQERLVKERVEQERVEQERLEKERAEQQRLKKERAEQERLEQERLEKERAERQRLEQERLEKERVEQERAEQERLEKERAEQQRLEKERAEQERLEKERAEQQRLEQEQLEKERVEKERAEQERLEKEQLEKERVEKEQAEQKRVDEEPDADKIHADQSSPCSSCKSTANNASAKFCRFCGTQMSRATPAKVAASPAPAAQPKPQTAGSKPRCASCKTENNHAAKFCRGCGRPMPTPSKTALDHQVPRRSEEPARQAQQTQIDQERQAQAERERQARIEQERQAQVERERQVRIEQERQAQAEREAQIEKARQAQAERERQAHAEEERQAQAERERQAQAERERQAHAEQERQAHAERERQAHAEQERQVQAEREAHMEKGRESEAARAQSERAGEWKTFVPHRPLGPGQRRLPGRAAEAKEAGRPIVGLRRAETAGQVDQAVRDALEARLHQRSSTAEEERRRDEHRAGLSAMPTALVSELTGRLQSRGRLAGAAGVGRSPFLSAARAQRQQQEHTVRLIRCVGRPRVFAVLVEPRWTSVKESSAYVLDSSATVVYVWSGSGASMAERQKAMALATAIKERERSGKAEIVRTDDGATAAAFWQALGRPHGDAAASSSGDDDDDDTVASSEAAGRYFNDRFSLHRLGGDGAAAVEHPSGLRMAMLEHEHCYLLDTQTELYLWLGARAKLTPAAALDAAQRLLAGAQRPDWTPTLQRVTAGAEPLLFREKFADWPESSVLLPGRSQPQQEHKARQDGAALADELDEALRLYGGQAELVSDVQAVRVLRVESRGGTTELDEAAHGVFDMESSYIVVCRQAAEHAVYLWQGKHAGRLTTGAASLSLTSICDALRRGGPVRQQLATGDDSDGGGSVQFRAVFAGRLAVLRRPLPAGHRGACRLLHVRACPALLRADSRCLAASCYALETSPSPAALNTNDAFVALGDAAPFVWLGAAAPAAVRDSALSIARRLAVAAEPQRLEEGAEPASFWRLLGGSRADYTAVEPREPALFFSLSVWGARPVLPYSQFDLDEHRPALLQSGPLFYLWSSKAVPDSTLRLVHDYARVWAARRGATSSVVQVEAGHEPADFTRHFHAWLPDRTAAFVARPSSSTRQPSSSPAPIIGGRRLVGAVPTLPPAALAALSQRSPAASST